MPGDEYRAANCLKVFNMTFLDGWSVGYRPLARSVDRLGP